MPRVPEDLHPNRMPPGVAHPVDVHVGSRVRQRRKLVGLSQTELGQELGLTFQQIQKYERGANRIGASRLYQIAQILQVTVNFFFEDMPPELESDGVHLDQLEHFKETASDTSDMITSDETTELVQGYYAINNPKKRKAVHDLIADLAKSDWSEGEG